MGPTVADKREEKAEIERNDESRGGGHGMVCWSEGIGDAFHAAKLADERRESKSAKTKKARPSPVEPFDVTVRVIRTSRNREPSCRS